MFCTGDDDGVIKVCPYQVISTNVRIYISPSFGTREGLKRSGDMATTLTSSLIFFGWGTKNNLYQQGMSSTHSNGLFVP
jgi:hypothetical protein